MVVDFITISILGEEVEMVVGYLGSQQQLGLERQHRGCREQTPILEEVSLNVCSKMLQMSYHSVVASTIFFAAICWNRSIRASDTNKLII